MSDENTLGGAAPAAPSPAEIAGNIPVSEAHGWYEGPETPVAEKIAYGEQSKTTAHREAEATAAQPNAPSGEQSAQQADVPASDAAQAPQTAAQSLINQPVRTYESFKLPEGVELDQTRVKEFTGFLDAGDLNHQDRAQRLIDLHVREMTQIQERMVQHQHDVWQKYNDGLKQEFRNDPEIGGMNAESSLMKAKTIIEDYGGNEQQQAALLQMLSYTGAGNHAGLIRMLSNIESVLAEGHPIGPVSPGRMGGPKSRGEAWYGKKG